MLARDSSCAGCPQIHHWRGQVLPALPWLPPQECLRNPDFSQLLCKVVSSPSECSSLLVAGTARDKCGAWSLPSHSSMREPNKWMTSYLPSLPKSAFLLSSTKMWYFYSLRLSWTTPSRTRKSSAVFSLPFASLLWALGKGGGKMCQWKTRSKAVMCTAWLFCICLHRGRAKITLKRKRWILIWVCAFSGLHDYMT